MDCFLNLRCLRLPATLVYLTNVKKYLLFNGAFYVKTGCYRVFYGLFKNLINFSFFLNLFNLGVRK